MTLHFNRFANVLTLLCALQGCALTSKADVTLPRYFRPTLPSRPERQRTPRAQVELRLGRVTAGSYIREKIIYRASPYEVGFYDDLLWTERPDAYLRRALHRVLFEEEGLRNALFGSAPVLDVELLNFEEVRAPLHIALVRLTFSLRDEHAVRMQRTVAVERPIEGGTKAHAADAVAQALGEALRGAVDEVSEQVLRGLTDAPVAAPVR